MAYANDYGWIYVFSWVSNILEEVYMHIYHHSHTYYEVLEEGEVQIERRIKRKFCFTKWEVVCRFCVSFA